MSYQDRKAYMQAWRAQNPHIVSAANRRQLKKKRWEFELGLRERAKEKRCSLCKQIKPAAEFYLSNTSKDGLHGWCRECSDAKAVEYQRRRQYGITSEEYQALLERQGGRCAICREPPAGKKKALCVDHCHATGRVRGLLCGRCNSAIGLARESAPILRAAAAYLEASENAPKPLTPAQRVAQAQRRQLEEGWRRLSLRLRPELARALEQVCRHTGETPTALLGRLLQAEAAKLNGS